MVARLLEVMEEVAQSSGVMVEVVRRRFLEAVVGLLWGESQLRGQVIEVVQS